MRYERCEQCRRWATGISLWSSAFLALLKGFVGVTCASKGCIADGLHSGVIFVAALAALLGRRLARKGKTDDFPYGFAKIEAVVTGSAAFLIACGGVVLIWSSMRHIVNAPQYGPPYPAALLMALVAIIANEVLARYLRCAGARLKMGSLLSIAWDHRENLVSSIIVFIGILGALLGIGVLDPIAAILVVAIVVKAAMRVALDSINTLMDFSANVIYRNKVMAIVEEIEGVQCLSAVRTRKIGRGVWFDLDISVNPGQSIREANQIELKVKNALFKRVAGLENVTINCTEGG